MKILITEDDPIQRMVLDNILKRNHYEVVVAACGADALKILESQPDVGLLISDIMMPDMDGLELLRRVKANPGFFDLPIILCTALADVDHIKAAAKLGCRYYIVKPLQVQVVLQRIQEALDDRKLILREAALSRQKLGVDAATFLTLAVTFEKLIHAQIVLIEAKLKCSAVDSNGVDLTGLHESAILLGAEKLGNILVDIQSGNDFSVIMLEEYQLLLRELKVLSLRLAKMISQLQPWHNAPLSGQAGDSAAEPPH